MTYLQFHLIFLLPPLLLLGFLTRRAWLRKQLPGFGLAALAVHVAVAVLYTTPWDNYLVARGVWGYGEGRVLFTLGWVPFEEYLFFVLQTLLTGMLTLLVGRGVLPRGPALSERRALPRKAFGPVQDEFTFAMSSDSNSVEDIQAFLDVSVKGGCEGLTVKMMDSTTTSRVGEGA